jgi:DNA polymerase-1
MLAKAMNFGLAYGSGARGFATYLKTAYGVEKTIEEAQELIDIFFDTYPGIKEWHNAQERRTRKEGYVSTLGGRRWFWHWRAKDWDDPALDNLADWQLDDAVAGFERNLSFNHPIQGTTAEIMAVALAYIDQALRPYDARLCAVVHDEVVLQVLDDEETKRAVKRLVMGKMTRAWLEFHPTAPWRGLVDFQYAPTWAESH